MTAATRLELPERLSLGTALPLGLRRCVPLLALALLAAPVALPAQLPSPVGPGTAAGAPTDRPSAPLLLPSSAVSPVRPTAITPGPVSMGTTPRPAAQVELRRPQIDVVRDGLPGNLGPEGGGRRRPLLLPAGGNAVTALHLRLDPSLRGKAIQIRCFRGLEAAVLGGGAGEPSFGVWHDAVIGASGTVLVLARLSDEDWHGEMHVVVDRVLTVVPVVGMKPEQLQRHLPSLSANWLRR